MVRYYKRTSDRGVQYSSEDLAKAVDEVRSGRSTVYNASKVFNIPYNTINDHVKGRRGVKSITQGRPTALSHDIEKNIADGLKEMEKCGLGLSRKHIMSLVGDFIRSNNMQTPFKDGSPKSDWLHEFMKRNQLSVKKTQSVEIGRRRCIDPFVINGYFDLLEKTVVQLGLENKPHLIFNLDETAFSRDPSKTKIVGEVGYPSTRTVSSPGRDNITVLLTASASGRKLPPVVVFKGVNIWDEWIPPRDRIYPDMSFSATKNGWMESETFEKFFEKTFLPSLGEESPALVICDGHKTHVSLQVINVARRKNITILILPPHSSHILQPLDLSVM